MLSGRRKPHAPGRCRAGGARPHRTGAYSGRGVMSASRGLTHFDAAGQAAMVDVSAKAETVREATARARITMRPETLALIESGTAKKGDVLGVARLAGIMAAKRTADLTPLCHPLPIAAVTVDLAPDTASSAVEITATVRTTGRT